MENISYASEPEMNLRDFNPRDAPGLFQSAYCKGELLVGINILDSILLIKGSAHRQGGTSQSLIEKCREPHTKRIKHPAGPVQH